jgi:polyisoprenoid-binding protein YceI
MPFFIARTASTLFLFALLALSFATKAQTFSTDTGTAMVHGGNGMTDYTGESHQLKGTIDASKKEVDFSLELETLKTGISKRNEHMYSALGTDEHPKAHFEGKYEGSLPDPGDQRKVTVDGRFKIHGVEKEIPVTGLVKNEGGRLMVVATFSIKITEYGIDRPGFWPMKVNDEHEIEVRSVLKKESAES